MEPGIQDDMSVLFKDDIWPDPMRYYVRPDTVDNNCILQSVKGSDLG